MERAGGVRRRGGRGASQPAKRRTRLGAGSV